MVLISSRLLTCVSRFLTFAREQENLRKVPDFRELTQSLTKDERTKPHMKNKKLMAFLKQVAVSRMACVCVCVCLFLLIIVSLSLSLCFDAILSPPCDPTYPILSTHLITLQTDVEQRGPAAFNRTLPFSEKEVAEQNADYLRLSLNLEKLTLISEVQSEEDTAKMAVAQPGAPNFTFQ